MQGIGALAGLVALAAQGIGRWRLRYAPRDVDGLRHLLDSAYSHVLPIASPLINGTPSLDIVEDAKTTMLVIDMPRYAGRLADPVLMAAVREAELKYHLLFAIGTNLNTAPEVRNRRLIEQQGVAAQQALDSIRRASNRLDDIEHRIRPIR